MPLSPPAKRVAHQFSVPSQLAWPKDSGLSVKTMLSDIEVREKSPSHSTQSRTGLFRLEFIDDLEIRAKLGTKVSQQLSGSGIETIAFVSIPWAWVGRVVLIERRIVPSADFTDTSDGLVGER